MSLIASGRVVRNVALAVLLLLAGCTNHSPTDGEADARIFPDVPDSWRTGSLSACYLLARPRPGYANPDPVHNCHRIPTKDECEKVTACKWWELTTCDTAQPRSFCERRAPHSYQTSGETLVLGPAWSWDCFVFRGVQAPQYWIRCGLKFEHYDGLCFAFYDTRCYDKPAPPVDSHARCNELFGDVINIPQDDPCFQKPNETSCEANDNCRWLADRISCNTGNQSSFCTQWIDPEYITGLRVTRFLRPPWSRECYLYSTSDIRLPGWKRCEPRRYQMVGSSCVVVPDPGACKTPGLIPIGE